MDASNSDGHRRTDAFPHMVIPKHPSHLCYISPEIRRNGIRGKERTIPRIRSSTSSRNVHTEVSHPAERAYYHEEEERGGEI